MSEDSAAVQNKAARSLPSVVIVMGVSGSGKSTIGTLLAERLNWKFEDADQFHPGRQCRQNAQGYSADR